MSFQAMAWAVGQKLPTMQKFVLLMLANRTNHDTGRCDPSHRRIADDCGMSPASVKRAIKSLVDDGYMSVEGRVKNGEKQPNQYLLHLDRVGSHRPNPPENDGGVGSQGAEVGSHGPDLGSERPEGVGSQGAIKQESSKQEVNTGSKPEKTSGCLPAPALVKPAKPLVKAKADPVELERQEACRNIWSAYAAAYFQRYNTEPVRNATVNGQVNNLLKRLGRDEAPAVAAFYVSINDAYLIRACHDLGSLLVKAEAYRTQWATGRQMNGTTARQLESTQANMNAAQQAKDMIREGGKRNAFL
ncbi:helix-turn-helix domain-containing protein [Pseudomonas sp. GG8]